MQALAERELCVCDLANLVGMRQSTVSHQLRLLRALRIVRFRKEGRVAYYTLDDAHVGGLLAQGLEHVREAGSAAGQGREEQSWRGLMVGQSPPIATASPSFNEQR